MSGIRSPLRRRVLLVAGIAPLAAVSGCVGIGRPARRHVSYELRDSGEPRPLPHAPLDRVALVSWSYASPFYDTTSIAYSRSAGALAYYQFASWAEPPAGQIGRLFVRRLAGARVFRDVATISATVPGDWLIDLQLDEMLHDDAVPPGVARISVFARIVDRTVHRTVDTQHFREEEALESESAEAAVQAFDVAVTRLLDAAVRWVRRVALGDR